MGGGEDIELGIRLNDAGAKFALCRNARALHLPHDKARPRDLSHAANYRYIARKHDKNPVAALLARYPEVDPFSLNEIAFEPAASRPATLASRGPGTDANHGAAAQQRIA